MTYDDNIKERFWKKVSPSNENGCRIWTGSKSLRGYGQFKAEDQNVSAHRFAWELANNCKVPEGKMILHTCDNPSCCNKDHLYCGTHTDNMRDRQQRYSVKPGTASWMAKLHGGEIWLIRRILAANIVPQWYIAKMFNVDQTTISLIKISGVRLSKEGTYV